ncbi:hypothetical protein ACFQYP_53480 [Nonomuraea antimicrobica]|uniref:hypothetical protein n=1 Tax=Nonomuraea antimicrobica TaxID=561173 RepID=UPI0031E67BEB
MARDGPTEQGAWLAIEDAVVLAGALDRSAVPEALIAYDAQRRPRTQPMAKLSGQLGHVLQTGNPVAATLRNALTRLLPTGVFLRLAGSAFAWTPPDRPTPPGPPTSGGRPTG